MKILLLVIVSLSVGYAVYYFNASLFNRYENLDEVKTQIRKQFPSVDQMSTDQLKNLMDKPDNERVILLDVREAEEFNVSHINNAELSTDLAAALAVLKDAPKDSHIIAYCSVGYRSSDLSKQLASWGYSNVHNLEGSIFEWANKGYSVYRDDEKVNEVHIYDKKWGKFLDKVYHP